MQMLYMTIYYIV